MKNILISLSILTLTGCISVTGTDGTNGTAGKSSVPASTAAAPYGIPHVKRPNLIVADIERSLKIYRDILGFTPSTISDSALDSFSYPVFNFPPEARMRYTYLGEPDEVRVLGLTEVRNIDLPRPSNAPYMYATVIAVSDLEAKFEKLEAMGLKVSPSKTTGGSEFRFIEQAFTDPDGHLIVCYEILSE